MKERNKMKLNLELSEQELKSYDLDKLTKHLQANASTIASMIYPDEYETMLKAQKSRGGEIKAISELAGSMVNLYEQRLKAISKDILMKAEKE